MDNKLLNELNEVFDEIKDKDGVYDRLPDGDYLAKIADITVGQSKNDKPMVTFVFEVTNGPKEGTQHRKFLMLTGKDESNLKQNLHRYATEVRKLGISTDAGLASTFDQLEEKIGLEVKMTITTTVNKNGTEWFNTSFEVLG